MTKMNMIPTFIKVIHADTDDGDSLSDDYWFGFLEAPYKNYNDINIIRKKQPLFSLNDPNVSQLEIVEQIKFYHDKNIPIQVISINEYQKTINFGPKWVLIVDSKVDKLLFDSKEKALEFISNEELSKFSLTKTYFFDV